MNDRDTAPTHGPRNAPAPPLPSEPALATRYRAVRQMSEKLAEPLSAEDCAVQSMPDASPTKWHLAHTSWFFETFLLKPAIPGYRPFHPAFEYLYNSYYNSVGEQYSRPDRGLLSRPALEEIADYRAHVDAHVSRLLAEPERLGREEQAVVVLGLHHEQQHQELILTDIKHMLACNPLEPVYVAAKTPAPASIRSLVFFSFEGGVYEVGAADAGGAVDDFAERGFETFRFDNEGPRHRVYVERFALASRLIRCGEYLAFMREGGYQRPELWLSEGWAKVCSEGWQAPLYWKERDGQHFEFTLGGLQPVRVEAPVTHVSYYEADAFARWAGCRLPREEEWELAAGSHAVEGNFVESGALHPRAAAGGEGLQQLFGDTWEWTASPYVAYPRYEAAAGALGEYNGKFMSNQMVLRGGSCVSPRSHLRASYRNFFPPDARWQFSGIRLARD